MKNMKTKTTTLLILFVLFIINSILLFSYYSFYLSDKISSDLVNAKNENYRNLYIMSRGLYRKNLDESINFIKLYIDKEGGYVSLKTISGDILFTNKKDISKLFSSTAIVNIDNVEYELTYSKISTTPGIKFIKNLIIFEILILGVIIVITFVISSKQLINPIELIIKDMNDYKYGKKPIKRKMPKRIQNIQNTFVDMVDNLEIKKEYQNQIIASISHDIKTPLTSVIGYADRLKNNDLNEEKKKKYIDKIYNKALHMKEILEEFDDYQSCNMKELIKKESIKIEELIDSIKKEYEEDLKDKNINLTIISNCDNKSIKIDMVKIRRVFSNVITNSVTHFKESAGIININFNYVDNKIRIELADNGGGISNEKDLKKIFEPLYTTDPSRKISGLGLSICKEIINAHNGRIYAKNNKIGGLSIIFILPI